MAALLQWLCKSNTKEEKEESWMDFVVRTHEGFHLATSRNGGFLTDKVKQAKAGSCCSSSSSLRSRRVTAAVRWSLETPAAYTSSSHNPGHFPRKNQVTINPYSSSDNSRLWKLVIKGNWGRGFTHLKNMVISRGAMPDLGASRILIEHLCKAGKTRMAEQVVQFLERSHRPTLNDVRIYNELILGLCKAGEIDNALDLFHRMEEECLCSPDAYTYNILVHAMFHQRGFEQGVEFLDELRRSKGFEPDAFTRGIVVNRLCKEKRLDEAVKLISSDGWTPCAEAYNAVINGFCEAGRLADAEKLLADMAARGREGWEGCSPSGYTFRILINTLCRKGFFDKAIDLLESMMPLYGCKPDQSHYRIIIYSLCKEKKLRIAVDYIEVMISRGCYPNLAIFNTVLAALWDEGNVDAGKELFCELKYSRCCPANRATYSIVIEGLSEVGGRSHEAIMVLDEMLLEGFEPGACTYTKVIQGLIRERKCYDDVMEILEELDRLQVELPCVGYNRFIDVLCSVGETDRAIDVLVYMAGKGCRANGATYASMIEGLARCGLGKEAMELVRELFSRGALDKNRTGGVTARIRRICSG